MHRYYKAPLHLAVNSRVVPTSIMIVSGALGMYPLNQGDKMAMTASHLLLQIKSPPRLIAG